MKVVVCGGGQVGQSIIDSLWKIADITLLDADHDIVDMLYDKYDIQAVVGSAISMVALREAEVDQADIFIAVTNSDEKNIIASILAENLGVDYVYARVRDPKYYEEGDFFKQSLGLTEIMNPEQDSARLIRQLLRFPTANSIEDLLHRQVQLVEITVSKESPLTGKSLQTLTQELNHEILVCAIERDHQVIIPQGQTEIQAGDNIYITGTQPNLKQFYKQIRANSRPAKRILIIGGGNISHYLIGELQSRPHTIKLIEWDRQRADKIAATYPSVEVILGDGTDQDLLIEEGIATYDAVVTLSPADEENILISLFAHSLGVTKVIPKVDRPYLLKPITHLGLESVVTPKLLVSDRIIHRVRSLIATQDSSVANFHQLVNGQVEALEFKIFRESKITEQTLADLRLIPDTLIAGIEREGQIIYPKGHDQIQAGDRVLVITKQANIHDINQILA
ncbi:potassium transporter TrkA [Aerococcus urinaehominis]|uniref:Trk system potassium uptake protein TrkA n=1 Tax=Aerococcus urinaehominis TaxID=128944 RepID=A0A109RH78_9LACT|nr:Trk system potassium transporter TrkA [Aerococcus urinaehominis]AMB99998.1 potassium transporter TrkA [Aerococcus urinaehominis]SDL82490.1 trk system potassium uptake protein TrkA [Aerococcus urinaehominis]